jgi:PBP1b-binding outer membrane lipoprotein LpoB
MGLYRTDGKGGHMKHSKIIELAVIGALAWSPCAVGQQKMHGSEAQFKAMDTNRDGKLSPAEHAAGAKKMFDAMDASKDGKVTAAEMDAAHQKVTGRSPSKDEMSSDEKIRAIDRNGDGILTAEEHAAGSKMMFEKMDTNKDGFLSPAEVKAGHANFLRRKEEGERRK